MAVTINASTSSGLIQTADTSGSLSLQANGTTIATVQSTGLNLSSNGLVFSDASTQTSTSLGYSPQAWQLFTLGTTRVIGTTYTNSTGRPISVALSYTGANGTTTITVGGILIFSTATGTGYNYQTSFIVPTGNTYVVTDSGSSINRWAELR
jgi:hypothetical protein